MTHSPFIDWLYDTHVSTLIRDTSWLIPTVQSIHIISVAMVFGSALVSDLKIGGFIRSDEYPAAIVRRFAPWLFSGLAVLLITGIVLVVGEPDRVLANWVFWTKMALVMIGFLVTLFLRNRILSFEEDGTVSGAIRGIALASILVWIFVIICGRWIAYVI